MPIDNSTPWGELSSPPPSLPIFNNEHDLSSVLSNLGPTKLQLREGDFVALTGGRHEGVGKKRKYRCDVLEVRGLEPPRWTIGTIELRRRKQRILGGFCIVTNLGTREGDRYSVRSHPNDGKFELIEALDGLTWRERMTLSRRFARGGDLAHPLVKQRQEISYEPRESLHVFVDGVYCGRHRVEIAIHPDFLEIYI